MNAGFPEIVLIGSFMYILCAHVIVDGFDLLNKIAMEVVSTLWSGWLSSVRTW